jgi:hypothetical protein
VPRAAALAFVVAACTSGDGGAVELSWRLRPTEGPVATMDAFLPSCDETMFGGGVVASIELDWTIGSSMSSASWSCNDGQGTTGFDLAPGSAVLSVSPVCEVGSVDPTTYVAPAPLIRTVIAGDAIDLGAVELVLQVESCTSQPCICGSGSAGA